MLSYIFNALLVVAIVLVAVTVVLAINGTKKHATYRECTGTIIGFYKNSSEGAVGSYEGVSISPVVEYNVDGNKYEFIGKFYSTNMKIGQSITVMYNPNNPSVASIKNGVIFAPIITGILAIILLIPVIVYYIIKSRGLV